MRADLSHPSSRPIEPTAGPDLRMLVCIVNYRAGHYVKALLESLSTAEGISGEQFARVIVVDNDSGDGSYELLAKTVAENHWENWAQVVAAGQNGGFAFGNNLAVELAAQEGFRPDYVFLLNPDARVEQQTLVELLRFMDAHPRAGIAGARLLNEDGSTFQAAWRFHTLLSEFEGAARSGPITRLLSKAAIHLPPVEQPRKVDWVSGAAMVVRREVIDAVGLMDEGYFLYFEETDWCLRAQRAGWTCWEVPSSRVVHYLGKSTQVTSKEGLERPMPRYWFESRRRYFAKNHGRVYAQASDVAKLLGMAVWKARCLVERRDPEMPPGFMRDFARAALRPFGDLSVKPDPPRVAGTLGHHGRGGPRNAPPMPRGDSNQNPTDIDLLSLLWEDYCTYDRNPLEFGFWTIALHRLGNARMDVRKRPLRIPLTIAYRAAALALLWGPGIQLDYTSKVGRRVRLWHHGGMWLLPRECGNDVHIRQNTTIGVANRFHLDAKPIIEDGVEIGSGVTIVGHVRIGHHSIIGANSLVNRDVPPESLVVGVPAQVVKRLGVASAREVLPPHRDSAPPSEA